MTLYFIQMEGADYYKIGYTDSQPESRIAPLQTACPRKLTLLAVANGELADESALHAAYQDRRTDGGEEWFSLTPDDVTQVIQRMERHEHSDQDQRPIDGATTFDVRPLRGGQQHAPSASRDDVSRQATAFDAARAKSVFHDVRREHQERLPSIHGQGRQDHCARHRGIHDNRPVRDSNL